MTRKEMIYEFLRKMKSQSGLDAVYTTEEISNAIGASRANVSTDLNRLFKEQRVEKIPGWPVRYRASNALISPMPATGRNPDKLADAEHVFDHYVGHSGSMSMEIEKAKAAVLYPLNGLPLLIGGRTGVGKTTFARLLYEYARRAGRIASGAKFVPFNCADYSTNPQLITAQLFGCVRGAYTGADEDHAGLVDAADGGVLFLDEVHRLPATAQEMLFSLMDFSQYRRLGEVDAVRTSHPILIMATTEERDSALLATFSRRIPVCITLPALAERSPLERLQLIRQLFVHEAGKLKLDLKVDELAVKTLLAYDCPGNVGQLENDIRVACAHAYVEYLLGKEPCLSVRIGDMPLHVKEGLRQIRGIYSDINLIATTLDIHARDADQSESAAGLFPDECCTDIYDTLERQYQTYSSSTKDRDYIELAMTLDIDNYIRRLMDRHSAGGGEGETVLPPLSEQAIRAVQKTSDVILCELGIVLEERYRMILASHIDTLLTRIRLGKPVRVSPVLGRIREERPALFDVAQQVEEYLRTDCGVAVPEGEVDLFANLLQQIISECDPSHRSGLLALCHALGGAGTMARVANTLLNKEYVAALEVEDKLTDETLCHLIEARLDELSGYGSILVMTDSQRLMELCTGMCESYKTPLYVLDDINTSMVIEAALLMEEKHASAQQVYRHLSAMKGNYRELSIREAVEMGRQAIVVACFSGCGVARRLKKIIESSFELPPEIEIVTMDIPSVSNLHDNIAALSADTQILCIVGMDVGLKTAFPFISLDEFVLGNGIKRLSSILDSSHVSHRLLTLSEGEDDELCENTFYSGKYLDGYLFYFSGDKMQPYLKQVCTALEDTRGEMQQGKRIMLTIHLAAMVERILFDTPQPPEPAARSAADLIAALAPLSAVYHITISDEECDMIEQILSLSLNH